MSSCKIKCSRNFQDKKQRKACLYQCKINASTSSDEKTRIPTVMLPHYETYNATLAPYTNSQFPSVPYDKPVKTHKNHKKNKK